MPAFNVEGVHEGVDFKRQRSTVVQGPLRDSRERFWIQLVAKQQAQIASARDTEFGRFILPTNSQPAAACRGIFADALAQVGLPGGARNSRNHSADSP